MQMCYNDLRIFESRLGTGVGCEHGTGSSEIKKKKKGNFFKQVNCGRGKAYTLF
jgi:hypothetical protein